MLIAQITDTHVRPLGVLAMGRVPTNRMLAAAVAHLMALEPRPDAVVASGDLVDKGETSEYAALRAILAPLPMPVFLIPGNHDDRAALRAAFVDHDYLPAAGEFLHYAIEDFPLRLVGLDTVIPGEAGGRMCAARLAWFEATLAAGKGRPTFVFMHHPPFATGIRHMDSIGLEGAEEFGAIVARHPEIERIACGHLHRPIQVRWQGTLVATAPSTAHQVVLDLTPAGPSDYNFEPPACQLHFWDAGSGLVSHTSYVGRFDGPYPFHPAEPAG